MSCENKDRKRNRILNFRVSEEELRLSCGTEKTPDSTGEGIGSGRNT